MSRQLNPYLGFDDTAREAMTFYQSVLGGTLEVMTFGDYGTEGDAARLVMHAQLATDDGFVLMASDRTPEMGGVTHGDQTHLCLNGDDTRPAAPLVGGAGCGRRGAHAAGEADVGRRVRRPHRPLRAAVDVQHRRHPRRVLSLSAAGPALRR